MTSNIKQVYIKKTKKNEIDLYVARFFSWLNILEKYFSIEERAYLRSKLGSFYHLFFLWFFIHVTLQKCNETCLKYLSFSKLFIFPSFVSEKKQKKKKESSLNRAKRRQKQNIEKLKAAPFKKSHTRQSMLMAVKRQETKIAPKKAEKNKKNHQGNSYKKRQERRKEFPKLNAKMLWYSSLSDILSWKFNVSKEKFSEEGYTGYSFFVSLVQTEKLNSLKEEDRKPYILYAEHVFSFVVSNVEYLALTQSNKKAFLSNLAKRLLTKPDGSYYTNKEYNSLVLNKCQKVVSKLA